MQFFIVRNLQQNQKISFHFDHLFKLGDLIVHNFVLKY